MRQARTQHLRQTPVFELLHQTRALARAQSLREAQLAENERQKEEQNRQTERLDWLEKNYGGDVNAHYGDDEWLENYARKFQTRLLLERGQILERYSAFCSAPDFAFLVSSRPDLCKRACWERQALAFAETHMVRLRRETPQQYLQRKRETVLSILLETAETKATIDRWIEDQVASIEDEDERERARQQFQDIAGNIINDLNAHSSKMSSSSDAPEDVEEKDCGEQDQEVY